jgi:hypothetical protein
MENGRRLAARIVIGACEAKLKFDLRGCRTQRRRGCWRDMMIARKVSKPKAKQASRLFLRRGFSVRPLQEWTGGCELSMAVRVV